jgi:hypothetical protein
VAGRRFSQEQYFRYVVAVSFIGWLVGFMLLNASFNNISVISWPSVLLVEVTAVP